MRTTELFESVYSDLNQGRTKLRALGGGETRLSLNSPESLARYAEILRPTILAALHSNRVKGWIVVSCLVALFLVACYLAVLGDVHHLRWLTATAIPGLGVTACWPILVLLRLRREDMALQMLPGLLPLLPPDDAAEVLKRMLLSNLGLSGATNKAVAKAQIAILVLCLMLSGIGTQCWAQGGERIEARPEEPERDRARPDRTWDPGEARASEKAGRLFRGDTSRVSRGQEALRSGDVTDHWARADVLNLITKHNRDRGDGSSATFAFAARNFLDRGNERLLERAKQSTSAGDLKNASLQYEEMLQDPGLDWELEQQTHLALRRCLYAWGWSSYHAGAWNDAAKALGDFIERAQPTDLDSEESIRMLATALVNAGRSAYANREWYNASFYFEKLFENDKNVGGKYSAHNSLVREFHRYVDSTPGMREEARLYWSRAKHLNEASNLPKGTTVIDILPEEGGSPFWRALPSYHSLHVFNANGDVDVVIPGNFLMAVLRDGEVQQRVANLQAVSSVVLTTAAKAAVETSPQLQMLMAGKPVWHTDSVKDAAENLQALEQSRPTMDDFSLAMLLPRNEEQKQKLGLSDWTTEDQKTIWAGAEQFIEHSGIQDIISEKLNRGGILGWWYGFSDDNETQARLIDSLKQKKNVLIFIAHGDREHLYMPDGRSIAVSDIQALDLHNNRPTVFLFSCEGGKGSKTDTSPALADALKQAGAGMVWSFAEKLDAGEALSAAGGLVDEVKHGKTMMEAITRLVQSLQKLGAPKLYLRVRADDAGVQSYAVGSGS